ncbi:MAG: sulfate adenylyltransferase [Candidatus Binatus sp.]|uniref:sulfate adenylyltransferase n=1 Tax=Candidatus Binatus sp. TaxID=2811406 RepID=UPI002716FD22|nr:sulfate adenylyltransferase [Candidatus Binatus sp.]MDO8434651.1 sulfate adenylyltransferase [Candidatus Binatus sp.]
MSVHEDPITAHGGGELVDLKATASEQASLRARAATLPVVTLNARDLADLEMLASGAFSPLTGFMGEADYKRSRDEMRLASGIPWSIPITLAVDEATARSLKIGSDIALATEDGKRLAIMQLAEIYQVDRRAEAKAVFGTDEDAHPGAKNVTSMPPYCLAGCITLIDEIPGRTFLEYPREPRQTRAEFRKRGWRKIVAFQTRNPTHRAHEYIQKAALEICDGIMIHPLVGETKGDDVPAAVRMETYKVLLDHYYPKDRAMLGVFPAHMRYGGPREAILHAIVRRNYGCTHFIVGRDHAGVGSYYGSYDAQKIFDRFKPEEIGITPLMFENTFYCKRCNGMASFKTCPHTEEDRLILSGTKVREMLRAGQPPPPEFTRPELAAILVAAMKESK